jgi:hypothetical protein
MKEKEMALSKIPTPSDLFCGKCTELSVLPDFKTALMTVRGFTTHRQVALWFHRNGHNVFEQ